MGLACHRGTTPGWSLHPDPVAHMGDGAQNRPGVPKHRPRDTKTQLQKMSFLGINGTTGATEHPDDQVPALPLLSWAGNLSSPLCKMDTTQSSSQRGHEA